MRIEEGTQFQCHLFGTFNLIGNFLWNRTSKRKHFLWKLNSMVTSCVGNSKFALESMIRLNCINVRDPVLTVSTENVDFLRTVFFELLEITSVSKDNFYALESPSIQTVVGVCANVRVGVGCAGSVYRFKIHNKIFKLKLHGHISQAGALPSFRMNKQKQKTHKIPVRTKHKLKILIAWLLASVLGK